MPAMNWPDVTHDNDVVAWLILGYLCSHPDAKDTVEGVKQWWLTGEGVEVDAEVARASLDYLVRLEWLTLINHRGGGTVYGLNQTRRHVLQRFLRNCSSISDSLGTGHTLN